MSDEETLKQLLKNLKMKRAIEVLERELARAQKMLSRGEDPAQVLERFSQALTNKFLHHPMQALNRATPHEREDLARALARLYPDASFADPAAEDEQE